MSTPGPMGWWKNDKAVGEVLSRLALPLFGAAAVHIQGSGVGKTVLLYEAARKVMGRDLDPGPQKIGDCVSWGYAGCVDLVACVEVVTGQAEAFSWDQRTCTEAMYALSRVEYGNLDGSMEDGSVGAWAAEAVSKGGTLPRSKLGAYDPQRAKQWGAKGLPDEYEPEAKRHLIQTVSLVRSYEEARDAIANGYPVAVCSMQGFSMTRDSNGFCRPEGSWAHCMKFCAVKDDNKPGLLCVQSWGADSPTGPKGEIDIPSNSWWVDPQTCTRMLDDGDSFALSQFQGYPAQKLDWLI